MTEITAAALERRRVNSIAREYEGRGYNVVINPTQVDLPVFLSGYQPDLIATSDDDNVVIEVKSHATLSETQELAALAREVEKKPGWRLELVVTNPRKGVRNGDEEQLLTQTQIDAYIAQASKLVDSGYKEAAFLLAWSVVEAQLRRLARSNNIKVREPASEYVIKELYTRGVLTYKDFKILNRRLVLRNKLAHGYPVPKLDLSKVRLLLKIGRRLAEPM